jgi:NitT/TauT family transport system substrate-binding protein
MKRLIVVTALLAIAAGCRKERDVAAPEPVTIAVAMMPTASLVHVAQAKGYFAREGLAVTFKPTAFGKPALAAAIAGEADLATSAETPVVFAEDRGESLSIIASIASSTRSNAVLAMRSAGIEKPADLNRKRIGVTRGTSGDFFLDTLLLSYSVDRRDVHFVDLKPEEMGDALARGDVDAVATWNPTALALLGRFGERVSAFYAEDLYAEVWLLVGRRGFVQRRPEVARKVLRALLRAEEFFRDHPDEARQAVIDAVPGQPGFLGEALRQLDLRVRLDQSLIVLMEEEARWIRRAARASESPPIDFLDAIEAAPLLAVRPESVGLIR